MNFECAKSSDIRSISYNVVTMTLAVTFTSGSTYVYFHVPMSVYEQLSQANDIAGESIGRLFAKLVKNSYEYVRCYSRSAQQ